MHQTIFSGEEHHLLSPPCTLVSDLILSKLKYRQAQKMTGVLTQMKGVQKQERRGKPEASKNEQNQG